MQPTPLKQNAVAASVLFAVLVAVFVAIARFGAIFTPLLLAFVLAWLLSPAVDFFVRKRVSRGLAVLCICLGGVTIVGLLLWGFVHSLSEEFGSVRINLPEYANRLYAMTPVEVKKGLGIETPEKLYESISDIERHLRSLSFNVVREALGFISKAFTSTIGFILAVVNYFVIPVYLIYLLLDFPKVSPAVVELVPSAYRGTFRERLDEIDGVLSAFVRGQLSVCAILAVLYSIGLYFIGIDLALAIGVFSGVTFIIPYLGTVLGILLSVFMAVLKFHDLLHPLLCLGWIIVVQAVEGWVITPNLVGNRVGINPVIALLALLLFGQLFGLLGMLVAVPAVAVLKILGRMMLEMYRESSFYRENV